MSDIIFWKNKVSELETECVDKQKEIDKLEAKEKEYIDSIHNHYDGYVREQSKNGAMKAMIDMYKEIVKNLSDVVRTFLDKSEGYFNCPECGCIEGNITPLNLKRIKSYSSAASIRLCKDCNKKNCTYREKMIMDYENREEGHYGCNTNGEHEKCNGCSLADTKKCSAAYTIWFNEPDNRNKENSEQINQKEVAQMLDIFEKQRGKFPERVDHPEYYGGKDNSYEAIKVIEAWGLGFCLGNSVKYISRAGKKDKSKEIEDLKKAVWYLERHIKSLEQ